MLSTVRGGRVFKGFSQDGVWAEFSKNLLDSPFKKDLSINVISTKSISPDHFRCVPFYIYFFFNNRLALDFLKTGGIKNNITIYDLSQLVHAKNSIVHLYSQKTEEKNITNW